MVSFLHLVDNQLPSYEKQKSPRLLKITQPPRGWTFTNCQNSSFFISQSFHRIEVVRNKRTRLEPI